MKMDSVFPKEHEVIKHADALLQSGEIDGESLSGHYKILLKNYKKLLRQTEKLTRSSDIQQRKLNRIQERLGKYVSYQLYKKIVHGKEKVEINTKRRKLTVFFSDIKDFSYVSSHMQGEALSQFLNSYLEMMTQIVVKWGGTLDKYMGDAIMVFFGDPEFTSDEEHAVRCVSMAIEMREKMKDLRKQWFDLGYQEPLHCRMGIATGYCTVGNFGTSERMDYTIIGTTVNLASRLEAAADVDEILISHETWGYVRNHVVCDPPVGLNLKGFHHKITAHKVLHPREKSKSDLLFMYDETKGINLIVDFSKISKEELVAMIENNSFQPKTPDTHD